MDRNQEAVSASAIQDVEVMQVADVQPPEWRSVLSFSHDLGKYTGCYSLQLVQSAESFAAIRISGFLSFKAGILSTRGCGDRRKRQAGVPGNQRRSGRSKQILNFSSQGNILMNPSFRHFQVESVSVHAAISDRLKKKPIFRNVDALAMEILNARRDKAPKLP